VDRLVGAIDDRLAELRETRLVATVDRDQCVLVYPLGDWQKLQDELLNLPNLDSETRWLQRLMVGYAADLGIQNGSDRGHLFRSRFEYSSGAAEAPLY